MANLRQETTQANVSLMTPDQQKVIHAFLDGGTLPETIGYDLVQRAKEAVAGLERVAVPPEEILMACPEGGMPCTVQELLEGFRSFVEGQTEGRDPNRVLA